MRGPSDAVRAVWDTADAHLLATYGFSILDIVRKNPKELTVHFGGKKGAAIKRNYMALMVEAPDGSGQVRRRDRGTTREGGLSRS